MTTPTVVVRTLLVDDDDGFRALMRTLLPTWATVVEEACDGCDAIAKAKVAAPDFILMDFHMPLVDGVAAALAIKSFLPAARILLVSAEDDVADAAGSAGVEFARKQALDEDTIAALLTA